MNSDHLSDKATGKVRRLFVGILLAGWLVILASLGTTLVMYSLGVILSALTGILILKSLGWAICGVGLVVLVVAWRRRQLRALFTRAALPGYVWASVVLSSLVILFYGVERWRGKRVWKQCAQEIAARGETLNLSSVRPPDVPDEQNFAKVPLIAGLLEARKTDDGAWHWRDSETARLGERLSKMQSRQRHDWDWQQEHALNLGEWTDQFCAATDAAVPDATTPAARALAALEPYGELLAVAQRACERPYARFPVDLKREGYYGSYQHLVVMRALSELLSVRAVAELELGRGDAALQDVRAGLRVAALAAQEPFWGSSHTLAAVRFWPIQPLWEGLARQRWSETHLAALQEELARLQPLARYTSFLRAQCLYLMDILEQLTPSRQSSGESHFSGLESADRVAVMLIRGVHPVGWAHLSQAAIYRFYWQWAGVVEADRHQVNLSLAKRRISVPSPDPLYLVFFLPRIEELAHTEPHAVAYAQTVVDLASVACALERYRMARGQPPARLDALVPTWITRVPPDVCTGQPLAYQVAPEGQFRLYSFGWNGVDDGGKAVLAPDWQGRLETRLREGDWTWDYAGIAGSNPN